jgi:hypothetical protein
MGGMFSVVKVRDDVKRGDYTDPGPYRHPAGTLANEYTAELPEPVRAQAPRDGAGTLKVRKPGPHGGHEGH